MGRWVALPKGIALIAFFLPWVTVSCSSRKMVEVTGWQLAIGKATVTNPFNGAVIEQAGDANGALGLAMVIIVVGLILCLRGGRAAMGGALATSLVALGLIWLGTRKINDAEVAREAAQRANGNPDAYAAALIHVEWQMGYWVAIGALVAAAVGAGLAFGGRSVRIGIAPSAPAG